MKKSILLICVLALSGVSSLSSAYAAKLRDPETMLEQLVEVSPKLDASNYLRARYLTLLLQYAGSEKDPEGIVEMFLDIQRVFYEHYLQDRDTYVQARFARRFQFNTPLLIEALFPDDPEEVREAIRIYKQQAE